MSYINKETTTSYNMDKTIRSERKAEEVIWVFPYALEKWEKRINLKKMEYILVQASERAIVYENEVVIQELSNGLYSLKRKEKAENLKIVFMTAAIFDIKWGFPQQQGVLTTDNIMIGASGSISLKISNPEVVCTNVLKQENVIITGKIRAHVNKLVKDAMKETVAQYKIDEIQKISKDELLMNIEPALVDSLMKLGFNSQDFSITGLGIPPEFRIY